MEHMGAIFEGEWNSFNGMFSEEADFMAQLLVTSSLPNEIPSGIHYEVSSTSWPTNMNIVGDNDSSIYSSRESYYPNAPHQYFVTDNNNFIAMDYFLMENKNNSSLIHMVNDNVMEAGDLLNQDVTNDSIESTENLLDDYLQGKNLLLGTEIETQMLQIFKENRISSSSGISKKRPRVTAGEVQKSKRSKNLKKFSKIDNNDEVDNNNNNNVLQKQRSRSSSFCSEEDDSNVSHELNGVTSNSSRVPKLNGTTRASRGSATDPQSLYARKKRERINERLRILQKLIPNGTKVDISTMLEEAVQYVKFLQLQIKLLSSDDHWMYAPLAYNGMDIGLHL